MLVYSNQTCLQTVTVLFSGIRITDQIGRGQFGTVHKGIWQESPGKSREVAVKTLQQEAEEQHRVKFLQEAAISGQFKHPNIVKLYGVVTIGEPVSFKLYSMYNTYYYTNKLKSVMGPTG